MLRSDNSDCPVSSVWSTVGFLIDTDYSVQNLEPCLGFRWLQNPAEVGWLVLFAILAPASLVNSVQVHGVLPGESKTACLRLIRIQKYCHNDLASKEGEQKEPDTKARPVPVVVCAELCIEHSTPG